jgi:dipeptidase D
MDMVCEKNESVSHDFLKDPLKLRIEDVNGDKWLTAEGTTLGADNGVGICYILTLLSKIRKGELDFNSMGFDLLFTVDEEQGLRGAFEVDESFIDGDFLINLDSEEDDAVTVGCAGGLVHFVEIKKKVKDLDSQDNKFIPIKIFISGLLGGHSGVDIHLGRGNALKILGELLWKLNNKYSIYLCSVDGGNRTNAIPRESTAIFYIKKEQSTEIIEDIKTIFNDIQIIFDGIEPNLELDIEKLEDSIQFEVLSENLQTYLLNIMFLLPNGPISMHPQINDLVFTSSNFAVISTRKNDIEIKLSQRSLSEYFKRVIWE